MKEWKGTKWEFKLDLEVADDYWPIYSEEGKLIVEINRPTIGLNKLPTEEEIKEATENAKLVVDAFNTMNKCGIMPSQLLELLKECSDVLEYTVNGHLYLEMDKQQAVYEKISRCTGK